MDSLIAMPATVIVFALGASVGSFINVVVYRLPAELSILWPPSRCPHCLHKLGKHENVPVLGWLWLRGRCRHCNSSIAVRYPLVEAATGMLFLLGFWTFGLSLPAFSSWFFFSWLLALSLIDLDTMTLPNPLTQSGLVVGLVFQIIAEITQQPSWVLGSVHPLMSGIIGAVLGLWLFDMIAILGSITLGQAAMGGGDAKLAAMLGAWLGWKYLLLAGFLACAVGAFAGGGALALGWINRRQPMPFGPFLALGGAIALIWGQAILSAYFRLFFPL